VDYDSDTLDYIHSLEVQINELEHQCEKKDLAITRLARENSIFQEQLDQYLGPV